MRKTPLEVVATSLPVLAIALLAVAAVGGLQALTNSRHDGRHGVRLYAGGDATRPVVPARETLPGVRTHTPTVQRRARHARVAARNAVSKPSRTPAAAPVRARPVAYSLPASAPATPSGPAAGSAPAPSVGNPPSRTQPKPSAPKPQETSAKTPAPAPVAPPASVGDGSKPQGKGDGDEHSPPRDTPGKDGAGHDGGGSGEQAHGDGHGHGGDDGGDGEGHGGGGD
jgi:hypothetical protein